MDDPRREASIGAQQAAPSQSFWQVVTLEGLADKTLDPACLAAAEWPRGRAQAT
jgi:hypothetical protein